MSRPPRRAVLAAAAWLACCAAPSGAPPEEVLGSWCPPGSRLQGGAGASSGFWCEDPAGEREGPSVARLADGRIEYGWWVAGAREGPWDVWNGPGCADERLFFDEGRLVRREPLDEIPCPHGTVARCRSEGILYERWCERAGAGGRPGPRSGPYLKVAMGRVVEKGRYERGAKAHTWLYWSYGRPGRGDARRHHLAPPSEARFFERGVEAWRRLQPEGLPGTLRP